MHVSYEDCIADSSHSNPNLHPHYCDQCPYVTFVSGFLDRHRLSNHSEGSYSLGPFSRPDRFDCSHCQYSFSTERHLVLHTRLKHKKTLLGVEPFKMHPLRDEKAFFGLQQPSMHGVDQFSQRSSQTTPTPTQSVSDAPADETTPRQSQEPSSDSSLTTSPTSRSLKPRNYVCSLCPYRATQKSALNVHFRRHTGEKPYACRSCDYKCAALNSLVVHNRIHTGEKPYKCQVCEKAFTQAGSLKAHHRVHKITPESVNQSSQNSTKIF